MRTEVTAESDNRDSILDIIAKNYKGSNRSALLGDGADSVNCGKGAGSLVITGTIGTTR